MSFDPRIDSLADGKAQDWETRALAAWNERGRRELLEPSDGVIGTGRRPGSGSMDDEESCINSIFLGLLGTRGRARGVWSGRVARGLQTGQARVYHRSAHRHWFAMNSVLGLGTGWTEDVARWLFPVASLGTRRRVRRSRGLITSHRELGPFIWPNGIVRGPG